MMELFKNVILACFTTILVAITYFIVTFILGARTLVKLAKTKVEEEKNNEES